MSMSMVGGKSLTFDDSIGLDTKVTYGDQNGNEVEIDIRKYCKLAKKSKDKDFFLAQLNWIEKKELTIGAFVISGMDKLAREFPEEIRSIMK